MKLTRRDALKLGIAGTGTLFSPLVPSESAVAATTPCPPGKVCCPSDLCMVGDFDNPPPRDRPSPLIQPFTQALPILQPMKAQRINGLDYYEITAQKARIELSPGQDGKPPITAEFWTYNGSIPGPLIHQEKTVESCVRFINQLGNDAQGNPICTSTHLHGMASLPQYDGYAEDLIPPNYYKDYYYPNNRASILWYHDHAVHNTSRNVYMGLAGIYIVDFEPEDFCEKPTVNPLPSGEFEIPLVLQDKAFEIPNLQQPSDWKLVFNDRVNHAGVYADVALVNGKPWPHLKVKRRKYYFRILNASASRTYQLMLSNTPTALPRRSDNFTRTGEPAQMMVIGSDAGLLAHPVPLSTPNQPLRIGVAERYGVVIDFAQFHPDVNHVYLRNLPFPGNLGAALPVMMRFDLEPGEVTDPVKIPNNLGIVTPREALLQAAVPQRKTLRFNRSFNNWVINGRTWDRNYVEVSPKRCDIQVWELINMGGWTHPVHIHLIDFQVLSRNGLPPFPYEMGWKDVVLLSDAEEVEVIARFAPHRGKYMIHCHNIVHEDHDMMTQLEILQLDEKGNVIIDKDENDKPLKNAPCELDPAKPLPAPKLGSQPPPDRFKEKLDACSTLPRPSTCPE